MPTRIISRSALARAAAMTVASLCLAAASAPAFADSPFVGVWDAEADGAAGAAGAAPYDHFEGTLTVTESDGVYAIDYVDTYPEPPADAGLTPFVVSDVVVDGSSFSFKRTAGTPEGLFVIVYEGTIAGDAFTGTVSSPVAPHLGVFAYSGKRR